MAETHSRASRAARARLVGLASSTPARSADAADRLGIDQGFAAIDDLLSDDAVTVVHVCTPNALHLEQSLAAIAAGKNVICEKPLATTVEDARRLTEAAAAAGVVATVPFVYRFHPMVRDARARFQNGEVGTLLTIHGSYLQDWLLEESDDNWRVDANAGGASRAFADIGSHLVDLIEFITGDRIARVAAAKRTFFRDRPGNKAIATEDAVTVAIETSSGAIGSLLVSQVAAGRKNALRLELSGSAEAIGFNQEEPDTLWLGRRHGSVTVSREATDLAADAARLSIVPAGHPLGYQDAFNAFVADSYAAINGASPDGLPTFADGLRAAIITDAVMEAAATARWVETA
jgi:predicted dehydrogenase